MPSATPSEMRLPVVPLALPLMLTGSVLHAETTESRGVTKPYVVAAVGDSLTDEKSHGGKFLSYLRRQCPKSRFDNYGKGAEMVNQMRRRFVRDILAPEKPSYTHVIVFGGVNDLYSDLTANRSLPRIQNDLQWMYEQARQRGMTVVALGVAPWGGFRRYYNPRRGENTVLLNRWMSEQVSSGLVQHYIDTYSLLSCGDATRLCPEFVKPFNDGLHFNERGHTKLGESLHRQVFANCE